MYTTPLPHSALIVDDDLFSREWEEEVLSRLGIDEVRGAADGARALEIISDGRWRAEVLLCDLQMPGMDGVELLRHLGERHFEGALILVSGVNHELLLSAERIAHAHRLRILGVVEKPLSAERIEQLLRDSTPPTTAAAGLPTPFSAEEIRRGMAAGEFTLHYQPKVTLAERRPVAVEALARWNHPRRGVVQPAAFIPVAEEEGFITELTDTLFPIAARQSAAWRAAGRALGMAFNLSISCCRSLELPDHLSRCIEESGARPEDLLFEVTESLVESDRTALLEVLIRLRMKGFGLSIDDFGTGHSTLDRLRQIPFSELKVDRGFVATAEYDPKARAIIESSLDLGHKLGLQVIAEGVENETQWALIRALGCDLAQGYLTGRPMPAEELERWLRDGAGESS